MSIILDDRERDLPAELAKLPTSPPVSLARLEFGDILFEGNGPAGSCLVGFERKKLSDLINSMKDRRLSGRQLRGMWKSFDYVHLIVEEIWREGSGGEIEVWGYDYRLKRAGWVPFYRSGKPSDRTAISFAQVDAYLSTIELKGNVIVKHTANTKQSAEYVCRRWRWFNEKTWEQHTSHDQIYTNTPAKGHGTSWGVEHEHDEEFGRLGRGRVVMQQGDATTAWRVAAQLPGVDRKAEVIARHFGSVRAMAVASEKEWQRIEFGEDPVSGKKRPGIGPVTAKAVVRAITETGA